MKIAVIGGGSMGMAFVRSWLAKEVQKKENILVIESCPERIKQIRSDMQIEVSSDFSLVKETQYVFIAVKPQDFGTVSAELTKLIKPEQIVVSIMAGVPLNKISQSLNGHKRVVRVMPNLPILTGSGISAFYVDPAVEQVAANILEQLLRAGGEVLRLDKEDLLNAVTAISGSGPGYVFYLLQNLMKVSKEFGFKDSESRHLIASTIRGSIDLWLNDRRTTEELCAAVTSKGGTTAAALSHFEENKLGTIVTEGIVKAKKRAEELAK